MLSLDQRIRQNAADYRGFFFSNHRISRPLTNHRPYYSRLKQVNPSIFMYRLRT